MHSKVVRIQHNLMKLKLRKNPVYGLYHTRAQATGDVQYLPQREYKEKEMEAKATRDKNSSKANC